MIKEETMTPSSHARWAGLSIAATVSGMLNAQVLRSKLEEAGIPAVLDYESAGLLYGITASGLALGQVHILVGDDDLEEAKRILNTPPPPGWDAEATASSLDPS
jgi:hypothetical protein